MISYVLAGMMLLQSSPQQFDLICEGTSNTTNSTGEVITEAIAERYRIDLDRMVWCAGTCPQPQNIFEANNAAIVLDSHQTPTVERSNMINRATGLMRGKLVMGVGSSYRIDMRVEAQCESAPHTAIPQARF
jgi:hypothetical protein